MSGNVFIVCAPSGAGKTSLVRELLRRDPLVQLSVSYTTRKARPGEQEGIDYHFVSPADFNAMLERGEFLESAQVHGNSYATSHTWIRQQRDAERDILLEIDWQGAQQVRRLIPDVIGIFILPPSFDELKTRLTARGQDSQATIEARIRGARAEIAHVAEFDYVIINRDFSQAANELTSIVCAARLRAATQLDRHRELVNKLNQAANG